MLLAIDVGNTNIVIGVFDRQALTVSWRLATLHDRTADELWVLLSRLMSGHDVDERAMHGVVMSSVVPSLTQPMIDMVQGYLGCHLLCVDATNAGLPVLYEPPADVGADRLVNALAARTKYARGAPVIVVDFGTATTFDVISSAGEYLGGVIAPGMTIAADALFQRAARLPRVDARKPSSVIGRTTVGSIESGLFYGHVALVDGMVAKLGLELAARRERGQAVCVATGGLAPAIAAEARAIDHVDADLTLIGLRLVWEQHAGSDAT